MSDRAGEDRGATVTRRAFLGTAGAGTMGALVPGRARADGRRADGRTQVRLDVNGDVREIAVEPRTTLLGALRDSLGLTGTKPGCERGECGACTVLVDGHPRYSCLTLALEAEGHAITTVEGLRRGTSLGDVQGAFVAEDAFQCGFCTPGQVMAAEGLLRALPSPGLEEIRRGMSGNLCRCGAYAHIFKAVARAARLRAATGGGR
jgi:xanthine dehydrogenase YagT iron-sulfur-binding subunit